MSESKIELTYWPVHGLAGAIRLTLVHAVGVDGFVDNYIWDPKVWEQMVAEKSDESPLLSVPCIQLPGGPILSQSTAILKAIGRRYNLLGDTVADQDFVDEVLGAMGDYHEEFVKLTYKAPKEEFEQWKSDFDTKTIPYFFGGLDKIMGKRKLDFIGGKSVSIADFKVYVNACALCVLHGTSTATEEFAAYSHLGPWAARMEALPSVKAFRESAMAKLHYNGPGANWDPIVVPNA